MLVTTSVLKVSDGSDNFVAYKDTSGTGLECVLIQKGKVIA